ncbi:MAG: peptidoglycan-binding protein [bacterium]|nr:peptidoglycan-binding protein [bacterium]
MKKLHIAPVLLALSILTTGVAQAQTYYPYVSASCVNLSSNLSFGSRGSEVTKLQTFLVAQNYPGGGSWMITGKFASATAQAVRNFQTQQGLLSTGNVDSTTRAAIANVSCGASSQSQSINYVQPGINYGNVYGTYPTYPLNNYNNFNNLYNYNPNYNYNVAGNLAITSLSANTGFFGSSVTIYGTGFDTFNNIVNFGTIQIGNLPSNGTSITFNVPSYAQSGNVDLRVTNSRGTSNPLTFTVYAYPTFCGQLGSCGGCGSYGFPNQQISWLGPNYNCGGSNPNPYAVSAPVISFLNPSSGGVGTTVTVFGTGFTTTGNSVRFGTGVIANLNSPDGRSVSFTIPVRLTGFGTQVVTLSTYNVSVTNSAGFTSNALPFTVTSLGSASLPSILSITGPTSLALGTMGVWSITVNNQSSSFLTVSVNWGDQNTFGSALSQPQTTVSQGTQTLTFSHAYVTGGNYTITFTASNSAGSNVSSATVSVPFAANPGNVTLSSLSPNSGRVGTQVALVGSGFTTLDNTIHFGIGGTMRVPSQNGTILFFTIPSAVSPCDVLTPGNVCAQFLQQVLPGSYPVFVTNGSGTSQTFNFQVLP